AVLAAARHKSKREIEEIIANLRPRAAVPSTVRKLPAPKQTPTIICPRETAFVEGTAVAAPALEQNAELRRPPVQPKTPAPITPLAPERYKLQCTLSRETYDRFRRVQDLMRHRVPDGDVATLVDRALTLLLAEVKRTKHAAVTRPRESVGEAHGRHVPATVKRAVWDRDGGQ